ncbi:hypothetical protein [Parashewanella curva]|uniref:hypothetical protein n=1 Tax=Parashewanella curva TaxID=2338552 RepID=UPI0014044C73|nr:hypothetical protein [Parashewanella curva]
MTAKATKPVKSLTTASKLSYFVNSASVEEKKKIYDIVMSKATKMQNDIIEQAKHIS